MGEMKVDNDGHQYYEVVAHKAVLAFQHPETGKFFFDCTNCIIKAFTQTDPVNHPSQMPVPGRNGIAYLPHTPEQLAERLTMPVNERMQGVSNISFTAPILTFASISPTRPPTPEGFYNGREGGTPMAEDSHNGTTEERTGVDPETRGLGSLAADDLIEAVLRQLAARHDPGELGRDPHNPDRGIITAEELLDAVREEIVRRHDLTGSGPRAHDRQGEHPPGGKTSMDTGEDTAAEAATASRPSQEDLDQEPLLRYPPSSTASTPPARMISPAQPAQPVLTSCNSFIANAGINVGGASPQATHATEDIPQINGLHALAEAVSTHSTGRATTGSPPPTMSKPPEPGEIQEEDTAPHVLFLSQVARPNSVSAAARLATKDPRLVAQRNAGGAEPPPPGTASSQPFRDAPGRLVRALQGKLACEPTQTPAASHLAQPCAGLWSTSSSPTPAQSHSAGALAVESVARALERNPHRRSISEAAQLPPPEVWSFAGRRYTSSSDDDTVSDSSDGEDVYAASLSPTNVGKLAALTSAALQSGRSIATVRSQPGGRTDEGDSLSSTSSYALVSPVRHPLTVPEAAAVSLEETTRAVKNERHDSSSEVDLPSPSEISDLDGLDFFEKIDMGASQNSEPREIDYFSSHAPFTGEVLMTTHSPNNGSYLTHDSEEEDDDENTTIRPMDVGQDSSRVAATHVDLHPVENSYLRSPSPLSLDTPRSTPSPTSPPATVPFSVLELPREYPPGLYDSRPASAPSSMDPHSRSLASPVTLSPSPSRSRRSSQDSMPPLQPIDGSTNDPSDSSSSDQVTGEPGQAERVNARVIEHDWARIQEELRRLSPSDWWGALDEDWGEVIFGDEPRAPPDYRAEPPQSAEDFFTHILNSTPEPEPSRYQKVQQVMGTLRRGTGIIVNGEMEDGAKLSAINQLNKWAQEQTVDILGARPTLAYAHPMSHTVSLRAAIRDFRVSLTRLELFRDYDMEQEAFLRRQPETFFEGERAGILNMFSEIACDTSTDRLFDFLQIYHPGAVVTNREHRRTLSSGARLHIHIHPNISAFPPAGEGHTGPFSFLYPEHCDENGALIRDMGNQIVETRRALVDGLRNIHDWVVTNRLQETVHRDMRNIPGYQRVPLNPFLFVEELYYLVGVLNILDFDGRANESDIIEQVLYAHPPVTFQTVRAVMRLGYLGGPIPAMAAMAQQELRARGSGRSAY
ncbi:hypothetical protein FB107DRAFT_252334 [Schizophyllum commune]